MSETLPNLPPADPRWVVNDLGYCVEVREHNPDFPEVIGRLMAVARPDRDGRWIARHRDGRSVPTSRATAMFDLLSLVDRADPDLDPYPLAATAGPGRDGDDQPHGAYPRRAPHPWTHGMIDDCLGCQRRIRFEVRPTDHPTMPGRAGWLHLAAGGAA